MSCDRKLAWWFTPHLGMQQALLSMLSYITVVSLRCLWKLTQHLMSHQVQHVLCTCFAAEAVHAGLEAAAAFAMHFLGLFSSNIALRCQRCPRRPVITASIRLQCSRYVTGQKALQCYKYPYSAELSHKLALPQLHTCATRVLLLCHTCAPVVPHLCSCCATRVLLLCHMCAPVVPHTCSCCATRVLLLCHTCAPAHLCSCCTYTRAL